jgi:hypothetical protein
LTPGDILTIGDLTFMPRFSDRRRTVGVFAPDRGQVHRDEARVHVPAKPKAGKCSDLFCRRTRAEFGDGGTGQIQAGHAVGLPGPVSLPVLLRSSRHRRS